MQHHISILILFKDNNFDGNNKIYLNFLEIMKTRDPANKSNNLASPEISTFTESSYFSTTDAKHNSKN